MSSADRPRSKQILPNMVSSAIFLAVNSLIGLLMVPYFETRLGISAYGIIPLATSVTSYMVLVSNSFSESVSRFMAMSVEKKDLASFERTYSTSAIGIARIVLMILPAGLFISLISPFVFSIGSIGDLDVQILFAGVICSALIFSWGIRFQNVLYAKNRLDYENIIRLSQIVIQTALIVMLFSIRGPTLWSIGVAYLFGSSISVFIGYVLARKVCPRIKIRRKDYDKDHFDDICRISFWSLIDSIGLLLMLQASMILTNMLLGPENNGMFGFVASIIYTISAVGGLLNSTFSPLIHYGYSSGKIDEMIANVRSAIKAIGMFIAMPIAFICVFSPQILTVWVGEAYAGLSDLVWMMLFLYPMFSAVIPLTTVGMAYLKVRALGLSNLACGILNIVLLLIFVNVFDAGLIGVASAWTLSTFIQKCMFIPLYYGKVTGVGKWGYVVPMVYTVGCFAICVFVCSAVQLLIGLPPSIIWIAVAGIVLTLAYIVVVSNLVFNKREKHLIRCCLPESVVSRMPRWFLKG